MKAPDDPQQKPKGRRILERTARGRADAREKGVKFGRKPTLTPHQRGAVLAGVGTACCALAGPRRNLRFVKSEWLRRRGLSLLIPGDAAGFSVVCTNRPLAASSTSHAVFRRAHDMRTQFRPCNLRRNPWLRTNQSICSRARGDKYSWRVHDVDQRRRSRAAYPFR
jgi:hypothetical protein